uniref:Uncharacterized protein n=1 Tax=Daphnia galeata TaxID=27404 RepID=A0A8J2S939_9CRUS|nr:unnamed protein product [Daphnia galeata]
MENNVEDTDSKEPTIKKEFWNGKKTASQITIVRLLKDNWESMSDTKTSKKLIWDVIANGLEEAGFTVRGVDQGNTCKTK